MKEAERQLVRIKASSASSSSEADLVYNNGTTYSGGVRQGMREGRGEFKNEAMGFVYRGEFSCDLAHGMGEATYLVHENDDDDKGSQIESKFLGLWAHGVRSGYGELKTSAGDSYEGMWEADCPSFGRWTFPDGSFFEGSYCNGVRAKGTHSSADGKDIYEGHFSGPDREGEGLLKIEGLYEYKGDFKHNVRHGRGECRYGPRSSLGCYVGSWADDQRSGVGDMKWLSGETYSGSWVADLRHGQGICRFSNGDQFSGLWANDLQTKGQMIYSNGEKYEGEFVSGRRHGFGRALFSDGTTFCGQWEDDCWVQSTADPKQSLVRLSQRATAGLPCEVFIQARDVKGHPRLTGGDVFVVRVYRVDDIVQGIASEDPTGDEEDNLIEGQVEDLGNGTYKCTYNAPEQSGIYRISVKAPTVLEEDPSAYEQGRDVQLAHCGDSPYLLRVLSDSPDQRKLKLSMTHELHGTAAEPNKSHGEGGIKATVGSTVALSIFVRDKHGNVCKGLKALSSLKLSGQVRGGSNGQSVTDVSFVPCSSKGSIRAEFVSPSSAGLYRLEIEVESGIVRSRPIPGSPFSLIVVDKGSNMFAEPIASRSGRKLEVVDWDRRVAEAMKGWEADDEGGGTIDQGSTAEDAFSAANPQIPIVDRLTDIWMVGKLQEMQKKKKILEAQRN